MAGKFRIVGLSHLTAPVAVREAVSPRPDEAGMLNRVVQSACGLSQVVVVSTCSRFEIYTRTDDAGEARIRAWLRERAGCGLGKAVYARAGEAAALHLFRVAGGVDSWIVGESEILGQVKSAYQNACREGTAGKSCHKAFQRAMNVGKRVRSETRIVGGVASIGGAAALLARKIFADLREKNILVFGAGQMAESTVRHLCSKGVRGVRVANRSLERGRVLAERLGGKAIALDAGLEKLAEADIAVVSTAKDGFLVDAAMMRAVAQRRGGRPVFLIDIAVPRNVDPAAGELEGVYVYDIDDLRRIMSESLSRRKEEAAKADALLEAEAAAFWDQLNAPIPAVPPPPRRVLIARGLLPANP